MKQGQGLVASDSLSSLLSTYAETAKSKVNLARAQRALGHKLTAHIDTSTEGGSGILRITARATDPEEAAAEAAATAEAFTQSISGNQLMLATLVDPASPNDTPVQPRPPLLFGVAGLLGLFGGILLALAFEQFRRRIETAADVAQHTTAPVLGRLDRQRTLSRGTASLIWEEKGADDLMESYRALRTNVEFLMDDATDNVIEVTSPEAAQGKSTVVANLAVAFSRIGIPTIVLDADLRRPRQHEIFGLDNSSGLSNMLALRHKPELKPAGPGLWVITSGPVPPDPTEMLHIRLPSVIKALRRRKALILVDTPPVLPVSDARLVAPLADGVILVATAGTQKPASFQAAIDRLALVDSRLLGVVLNKAGAATTSTSAPTTATRRPARPRSASAPSLPRGCRPRPHRRRAPPPRHAPPSAPRAGTRTTAPPVEQV